MNRQRTQKPHRVASAYRLLSHCRSGIRIGVEHAQNDKTTRRSHRSLIRFDPEVGFFQQAHARLAELEDAPDSRPGSFGSEGSTPSAGTYSHAPRWLMILAVGLVLGLTLDATADKAFAHEPGRKDCREYQQMHAFVTGSPRLGAVAGRKCRVKVAAHVLIHPLPNALIPPVMRRVRTCESGGNYRAQNPVSTASGAWQFLDTTWGGYRGYAKARHAPPRVQDLKALRHYSLYGTAPWDTSRGCWS